MRSTIYRQILFFTFFSGLAAAINIGSRYYFSEMLFIDFTAAVAISYFLGMIANYLTNKYLNFPHGPRNVIKEMRTFIVVALIGLGITIFLSMVFIRLIETWRLPILSDKNIKTVAHISAVGITAIYSFVCHKYLTYRGGIRIAIRKIMGRGSA